MALPMCGRGTGPHDVCIFVCVSTVQHESVARGAFTLKQAATLADMAFWQQEQLIPQGSNRMTIPERYMAGI